MVSFFGSLLTWPNRGMDFSGSMVDWGCWYALSLRQSQIAGAPGAPCPGWMLWYFSSKISIYFSFTNVITVHGPMTHEKSREVFLKVPLVCDEEAPSPISETAGFWICKWEDRVLWWHYSQRGIRHKLKGKNKSHGIFSSMDQSISSHLESQ